MYAAEINKGYFLIYFSECEELVKIDIEYDSDFFENKVLPNIKIFYFQYYLPEIT